MKKISFIILVTLSFLFLFTACTTPTQSIPTTRSYTTEGKVTQLVPDENATGELVVEYYGFYAQGFESDAHLAVDIFKRLYPKVKLNFNFIDYTIQPDFEAYDKNLTTRIMSGNAPDVFWLGDSIDKAKAMRSGVLLDMFSYFEDDICFNADDYNQKILRYDQYNGGQYTVPLRYGIPLMLTTKEIAKQIGYNQDKPLDFYETTKLLINTQKEQSNNFGGGDIIQNLTIQDSLMFFSGVNFYDVDKMEASLDNTDFKKVIEAQKELLKLYPKTDNMVMGGNVGASALKSGKTAIWSDNTICFFPFIDSVRMLGDEAVIIPYRDINKNIQAVKMQEVAISSNSENKDNAYKFIKVLMDKEVSSNYAINANASNHMQIPISNASVKNLLENARQEDVYFDFTRPAISQDFIDYYLHLINDIDGVYSYTPVTPIIQNSFNPYFKDEKPYDECIKNAQEALEIYVSE